MAKFDAWGGAWLQDWLEDWFPDETVIIPNNVVRSIVRFEGSSATGIFKSRETKGVFKSSGAKGSFK